MVKNKLKIPAIKINTTDLIYLIFVVVEFLRFFTVIPLIAANIFFVILGITSIFFVNIKFGLKKQYSIVVFIFIYAFFGILGVITNGNINLQEMMWPVAFIGISLLLLNSNINYKLAKNMYFLSNLLLIVRIVTLGSVDKIEAVSSRNAISVLVLLMFSFYAISSYKNNEKVSVFSVIYGLIVVTIAIGRSGILSFLLLLFFFLIFEFNGKKHKVKKILKIVMSIVIIALFFFVAYMIFESYIIVTIRNFENRGVESLRTALWKDYINKALTSINYFVFGAPIEGTYLLNLYNSNLHNSFLMLHAKYGIFIFVSIVIMIIQSLIYFLRKKNYLFLTLLIVLLFRMQFDYTNFSAQLDVVLFYLIFFQQHEDKILTKQTTNLKGDE